jgi:predicted NBD/HSP70 family sugar kinase
MGKLCEVAHTARAADTDPAAAVAFIEFGRHLGLTIRTLFAAVSPDVIVLGGRILRSAHLILSAALGVLEETLFKLQNSVLLDKALLVGAGVAWFNGANGCSS